MTKSEILFRLKKRLLQTIFYGPVFTNFALAKNSIEANVVVGVAGKKPARLPFFIAFLVDLYRCPFNKGNVNSMEKCKR